MKIPREAMTPALDAALAEFFGNGDWIRATEKLSDSRDPDRARDLLRSYEDLNGGRSLLTGLCIVATVVGLFWAVINSMIAFALIPAGAIALLFGYSAWLRSIRPDGPTPTSDYLGAALPRLRLAPVQRRYAEVLVAIYSGRTSDPGGEGLPLLRRLADEETRLLAIAPANAGAGRGEIQKEAAQLRVRIAEARDESAREAFTQSLALAEGRLAVAERAAAIHERVDAHKALLDQASRAATEGLLNRNHGMSDLAGLRQNVASLGRDVSALEAAVQEIGAL